MFLPGGLGDPRGSDPRGSDPRGSGDGSGRGPESDDGSGASAEESDGPSDGPNALLVELRLGSGAGPGGLMEGLAREGAERRRVAKRATRLERRRRERQREAAAASSQIILVQHYRSMLGGGVPRRASSATCAAGISILGCSTGAPQPQGYGVREQLRRQRESIAATRMQALRRGHLDRGGEGAPEGEGVGTPSPPASRRRPRVDGAALAGGGRGGRGCVPGPQRSAKRSVGRPSSGGRGDAHPGGRPRAHGTQPGPFEAP